MNPGGKLVLWMAGILMLWAAVLTVDQARGHEAHGSGFKYPYFCCHDADCAPVTKFTDQDGRGMAQTSLHKNISIDPKLYTHKMVSPDGRMHICASPDGAQGNRLYYCIFNPEGM